MYNRTGDASMIQDTPREEETEAGQAADPEGEVRLL